MCAKAIRADAGLHDVVLAWNSLVIGCTSWKPPDVILGCLHEFPEDRVQEQPNLAKVSMDDLGMRCAGNRMLPSHLAWMIW